MASLDFPSNPTNNQTYSLNGVTYYYNSAIGAWLTQLSTMNLSTSSNTQVLFNDAGIANGSSGLVFDKSANTVYTNNLVLGGQNVLSTLASAYTFSWDTTVKTSAFTALTNTGYLVNTTSGAVVVNLPATPAVGTKVAVADYAGTSGTNNIILNLNGSKMNGITANGIINTSRASFNLIYADSTQGWINQASTTQASVAQNYDITYLVVAGGGGGGGRYYSGGGGAGGYRAATVTISTGNILTVTIGAGGAGGSGDNVRGSNGVNSSVTSSSASFSTITAAGGGGGGSYNSNGTGFSGGSGGGNSGYFTSAGTAGQAIPAGQGNAGGIGGTYGGGGGGGAGAAGSNGTSTVGGNGGAGLNWQSLGTFYAGGGGGGAYGGAGGSGGSGGGGNGGSGSVNPTAGTTNRGGGGGASSAYISIANAELGAAGGSGIVIISYTSPVQIGSGGTVTSAGGVFYHTFTSSGTYTS